MTIYDHLFIVEGEKVKGSLQDNIRMLEAYINWGFSFNQPVGASLNGRSEEFRAWLDLGILVNHVAYSGKSVGVDEEGIKWLLADSGNRKKLLDIDLLCKLGYVRVTDLDGRKAYFVTDKVLSHL